MRSNAAAFGRSTYAVLIGVDNTHPSLELSPLLSPEADVDKLADALTDEEGCALPPENVTTLCGEEADLAMIRTTLDDVVSDMPKNATLFVYFAGHGVAKDEEHYLCVHDTQHETLAKTALTAADIEAAIEGHRLRGVLVVLDCCRGAGFGVRADRFFRHDSDQEYRLLIASAGADEPSYERADGTGTLFTEGLISILSGRTILGGDPHVIRFNGLMTTLNHYVAEQLELQAGRHQQLRAIGIHHNDPILFVHRGLSLQSIELNTARYSRAYVRRRVARWGKIVAALVFFATVSAYGWLDASEYVSNDGRYLSIYRGHPDFNLPGFPRHEWTLDYGTEALLQQPTGDSFVLTAPVGQSVLPLLDVLIRLDVHAGIAANAGEMDSARGYATAVLDRPGDFAPEQQLFAALVLASIAYHEDRDRFVEMLTDARSDVRRAGVLALVQVDPAFILARDKTGLPEVDTFNGPSFFPHADVLKMLEGDCKKPVRDYLADLLTINSNEPEVDHVIDVAVRLDCELTAQELAATTQRSAFWGHDEISFYANYKGIVQPVLAELKRALDAGDIESWDVGEVHDALYYFDDIDCPKSAVEAWQSDIAMNWLSAAGALARHCQGYALDIVWDLDEEKFDLRLLKDGSVLREAKMEAEESFGYEFLFVFRELEHRPIAEFEDALHHIVNTVLDTQVNESALRLLMQLGSQKPIDPQFLDNNVLATRRTAVEYERRRGAEGLEKALVSRIGNQDEFYVELLGRMHLGDGAVRALTNALSGSERQRQQAACVLAMQAPTEDVLGLLTSPNALIRHESASCVSFHRDFESIVQGLTRFDGAYGIRDIETLKAMASRKNRLVRRLDAMSVEQRRTRLELIQIAPWGLWDKGMRYWVNEAIFQTWARPSDPHLGRE